MADKEQPRKKGVIDPCVGILTNHEVLTLLKAQSVQRSANESRTPMAVRRARSARAPALAELTPFPAQGARRTSSSQPASVLRELAFAAAVNEDVVAHLEETCAARQSHEGIAAFIAAVGPYNLKHAEVLNLINEQPKTLVEVHLIVEDAEERLPGDLALELLSQVALLSAASNGAAAANGLF